MEKQKYLNEEKYQKSKNKIKIVATCILIIGLLIGGGLITTGIIKYKQTKLNSEEISKVQIEIDDHNMKLSSLKAKQSQEFKSNGFSEKYYNLENEIDKVEDKIDDLKDSLNKDTSWLVIFYITGGFVIFVTFMISGSIYAAAHGREIYAFYAQQQIPVAKEGIEEMAPSVGAAAKEIAKGIKDGINDEEK